MSGSLESERHASVIRTLTDALTDAGLSPELVRANPGDPVSLVVPVPPDKQGRTQAVALTPIPLEEELPHVDLVQLHIVLPFEAGPGEPPEAARAIVVANRYATLGHFGLRGSEVYFRHVWSLPPAGLGLDAVLELLQLFVGLSQALGEALEGVLDGSSTVEQLHETLS